MRLKTLFCLSLITMVALLGQAVQTQTFSVIYSFLGYMDGAYPEAGVTIRGGVLYGTTSSGGSNHYSSGNVYQLTRGQNGWVLVPLTTFPSGPYQPLARVVFGPDGHPYGTAQEGGNGVGGVFDLIAPLSICKTVNCSWTEHVLYQFSGNDGANPGGGDLVWDQQGNIYGTTYSGGHPNYDGVVYQLQPSGNGWKETVIYSFSGVDDSGPESGVTFDSGGNLFGTALRGGPSGYGSVYKLTRSGNEWVESEIYDFQGGNDGKYPKAGVIVDSSGNLLGGTLDGGSSGGGTIFELSPAGDGYTFNLLHRFFGTPGNFCGLPANLTMDGAGSLYGTTACDGAHGSGNVFKLTNTGNGWVYTSLYDFTGGNDGRVPVSNVTIDTDGTLYGTTQFGGRSDNGTVWMIKP